MNIDDPTCRDQDLVQPNKFIKKEKEGQTRTFSLSTKWGHSKEADAAARSLQSCLFVTPDLAGGGMGFKLPGQADVFGPKATPQVALS